MSTSYAVACERCGCSMHLGTRFAGGATFGEATADDAGRVRALEFIIDHDHGGPSTLRVLSEHDPASRRFPELDE